MNRGYSRLPGVSGLPTFNRMLAVISALAMVTFLTPAVSGAQPTCTRDLQAIKTANSTVLPWDKDHVGQYWEERPKFYVIATVQSLSDGAAPSPAQPLPFTTSDANVLAATLCRFGYAPLQSSADSVLTGDNATSQRFLRALAPLADLTRDTEPLVVVYYSGHGIVDGQGTDLFLQFHEQRSASALEGMSLRGLIDKIRSIYAGPLTIVIDACFSGTGAVAALLPNINNKDTSIFTSSSGLQVSHPITTQGKTMSAFTSTLVAGLSNDWETVNSNGDGLLWLKDLKFYTDVRLRALKAAGAIPEPMTPFLTEIADPLPLAYDRSHLKNPNSIARAYFIDVDVEPLSPPPPTPSPGPVPPPLPPNPNSVPKVLTLKSGDTLLSQIQIDSGARHRIVRVPFGTANVTLSVSNRIGAELAKVNVNLLASPGASEIAVAGSQLDVRTVALGSITATMKSLSLTDVR